MARDERLVTAIKLLCRLENPVGLQTGGADFEADNSSVYSGAHILEVRKPPAPGLVMRVADIVSGYRFFSTDFADSGHQTSHWGD